PDGTVKVLVEGKKRARIRKFVPHDDFFLCEVEGVDERPTSIAGAPAGEGSQVELEALTRSVQSTFETYVRLNKRIAPETLMQVQTSDDPVRLADAIVVHLSAVKLHDKQEILETTDAAKRLERLFELMNAEIEILNVEKKIRSRVKKELRKLKMMQPMSAEATVVRNYIDWVLGLPWEDKTEENYDIELAEKILDEDHYGLKKVKERVLEYLAVQALVRKLKGPVLCLVGPPGVGKTSLGQSIARATGRKFARVALGGTHDEAEIRGHRRTYLGALPGNIIQAIRKAGERDCVMMLDEIDKLGAGGFHGDPSSALLEVLDPEQNSTFRDNYLAVPFDLSRVMFIATANMLETIPGPLLDRMEVIQLSGYTENEKLQIARRYLVRRQLDANGLSAEQCTITDAALTAIIRSYTRESGVRNLERQIGSVFRNVAMRIAEGTAQQVTIDADDLTPILGQVRYESETAQRTSVPGVATGLAWTPVGGDILFIEASRVPGSGRLVLTGQLGDVMKESAQAALTLVKSRLAALGISDGDDLSKSDIHVHVPAGATPKDGPSAGVAMYTALASLLSARTVKSDVAMTGEISLRGLVMPVGGIKEKVIAAHRAGIRTVMLPKRNERDLEDIPEDVRKELRFVWLERVEQAIETALDPRA
ncbi:MAG: endopeptidase La, partial [Gammaproteobacteria bacterium]